MDWPNERYVRLYTRDTTGWLLLPWQARALLPLVLRKVDRAGVLDLPSCEHEVVEVVALVVGMPPDVVGVGLAALCKVGAIELAHTTLVLPNFLEAQEAQQSGAQRQRESRARRRAKARTGTSGERETSPSASGSSHEHGCVYFAQAETGEVKIGAASDVDRRLSALRSLSPSPITLVATLEDGRQEADVHATFAESRLHGEWFKPSRAMRGWLSEHSLCHSGLRLVTQCDNESSSVTKPSLLPSQTEPNQPSRAGSPACEEQDAGQGAGCNRDLDHLIGELARWQTLRAIYDRTAVAEMLLGRMMANAVSLDDATAAIADAAADLPPSSDAAECQRKVRVYVDNATRSRRRRESAAQNDAGRTSETAHNTRKAAEAAHYEAKERRQRDGWERDQAAPEQAAAAIDGLLGQLGGKA